MSRGHWFKGRHVALVGASWYVDGLGSFDSREAAHNAINRQVATCQTERPIKACSCGCQYSLATWASLHLVSEGKGGGFDCLEMRLCKDCNTSLAMPVAS